MVSWRTPILYTLGYNAPEARILPADFDWKQREVLDAALKKLHRCAAAADD